MNSSNAILGAAVLGSAVLNGVPLSTDGNAVISSDAGGSVVKETIYITDEDGNRIIDEDNNYIIE